MVDKTEATIAVIAVAIVAIIIGVYIGATATNRHYQKQAIERGYAEHNAVTGEWQWKETKGQSDED